MASSIQVNTTQEKGKFSLRKPFRYAVCILLVVLALFVWLFGAGGVLIASDIVLAVALRSE